MKLISFFLVFIGGGIGSVVRFLLSIMGNSSSIEFPFGTFLSNSLACLLVGIVSGFLSFHAFKMEDAQIKLLLITGFCGGFSTFSGFTNEMYQLYKAQNWWVLVGYFTLTNALCIIMLLLGNELGSKLRF